MAPVVLKVFFPSAAQQGFHSSIAQNGPDSLLILFIICLRILKMSWLKGKHHWSIQAYVSWVFFWWSQQLRVYATWRLPDNPVTSNVKPLHLRMLLIVPSCAWLPFSLWWSSSLSSWSCWTWSCSSSHLLLHCCSFWCSSCTREHKNMNPGCREWDTDIQCSTSNLLSIQIFYELHCVSAGVSHCWEDTDVLLKVLQKIMTSGEFCLLFTYRELTLVNNNGCKIA